MDRVVDLADHFARRTSDALNILEELNRQFCDLVVVPYYRDTANGKNPKSLRHAFRPEAFRPFLNQKHLCYPGLLGIGFRTANNFNVVIENAVFPTSEIIESLQLCEDRQDKVPFSKQVLIEAVQALDSRDPEKILDHSKKILTQLKRSAL